MKTLDAIGSIVTDFQAVESRNNKNCLSLSDNKAKHTTEYIRSCRWTHSQTCENLRQGCNGQLRLRFGVDVAHLCQRSAHLRVFELSLRLF